MDVTTLPDWRVAKAAELAADATLPDGRRAKKGDVIVLVTTTNGALEGRVTFATPGAAALAIHTAIREAKVAAELRKSVPWQKAPRGVERFLTGQGVNALFDYFEHAMIAAVFSFQSLEAFANQIIANIDDLKYPLLRRDEVKEVTGEELERLSSTEEKLGTILPELCGVGSANGTAIWGKYKTLKSVRDSITHLKSYDHYIRHRVDNETVYFRLLQNDPRQYPNTAMQLMRHFSATEGPVWLDEAERVAGILAP